MEWLIVLIEVIWWLVSPVIGFIVLAWIVALFIKTVASFME